MPCPTSRAIVRAVPSRETIIVIDGYHGFLAIPTDFGPISGRAFYMAGGYKYAMAGEGACFLHVPPGQALRPRDTGWFASFGTLETGDDGAVPYATGGARFLGATFDPVGLYRFNAVMDWLAGLGVTADAIHAHVHALQRDFIDRLTALGLAALQPAQLVVPLEQPGRGHFLTFRTPEAGTLYQRLLDAGVVTDYRGDRLRFGFGLYHDALTSSGCASASRPCCAEPPLRACARRCGRPRGPAPADSGWENSRLVVDPDLPRGQNPACWPSARKVLDGELVGPLGVDDLAGAEPERAPGNRDRLIGQAFSMPISMRPAAALYSAR